MYNFIDNLINIYIIIACINVFICLSIYFELELYNDWHRNRTDLWFILALGLVLIFVPIVNAVALWFAVFLIIIMPLVEAITPYRYNYTKAKFERKK